MFKNLKRIDNLINYDLTDSLNPTRWFIYEYGCFPHILGINPSEKKRRCDNGVTFKFDVEKVIKFMEENKRYQYIGYEVNRIEDVNEKGDHYNKRIIVNVPRMKCLIHSREELLTDSNHQDRRSDYLEIYYVDDNNELKELIQDIWEYAYEEIEVPKANLFAIKQTTEGFELTPQIIQEVNVDIDSNYNDDFKQADKVISEFISNDEDHGIVILNGAMGTGKTTYIRHLINTNKNNKFILGTKNIAEQIAEPSFIEFLSRNQNSVLILEDCENIVRKRSMNEGSAVTNLLNVGDGLLSDSLKIKIIITFNTDLRNIDSALQRKGRLRYQYTFENLSKEKSKKLLEKTGHEDVTVKQPMSLADIYNYDKENNVSTKIETIGFA